jgi:hypothetical protein
MFLIDEFVVCFGQLSKLLLSFLSWVIFRVVFDSICSVSIFDFVNVSFLINSEDSVGIKLLSYFIGEMLLKELFFFFFEFGRIIEMVFEKVIESFKSVVLFLFELMNSIVPQRLRIDWLKGEWLTDKRLPK